MSFKTTWFALLCAVALALPVAAQEEPETPPAPDAPEAKAETPPPPPKKSSVEDPPLHRWGGWTISIGAWGPTLVGVDEQVASLDSNGTSQPVYQRSDNDIQETIKVAYHLPHDNGSIVATIDSMKHDDTADVFLPGQFILGETRIYPQFAGAFDDGFADGVSSQGVRKTREFRLEYQHRAIDTKWVRASWGVGFRELTHDRVLDSTYYAIVPNFPPIMPPVVGDNFDPATLAPRADEVAQISEFSGHGLGVSFDVDFRVHPRVSIVSGISIGLYRGDVQSSYSAVTSAYFLGASETPMTTDELIAFLTSPPAGTGDPNDPPPPTIQDIHQESFVNAIQTTTDSALAQSWDIYLGVQVAVWRGLRVFATLRDVSYMDVGKYIVPRPGPTTVTTTVDAGYEGYIVGLSWRF